MISPSFPDTFLLALGVFTRLYAAKDIVIDEYHDVTDYKSLLIPKRHSE